MSATVQDDAQADLIVTNGKIATLDPQNRIAEAIAIRDGRILHVGNMSDVARWNGVHTQQIDASGRLVVPGLIDGHAHMDREGLKECLPSLAGCASISDILECIRTLVANTPVGQWIVTMPIGEPPFYEGVPDTLKEGRFPTRHELDSVAAEHPVYIRAIWGHWRNSLPLVSIANTLALRIAGVTRDTLPPVASVQIDKEPATGDPSGIFYEFTYKPIVEKTLMACIPRFSVLDRIEGLRRSMSVYNAYATTSVFEGHGVAGEVLAAYQALAEEGPLPVRSALMFSPSWPSSDANVVKELLLDWGRWLAGRGLGDEHLQVFGLYTESDYSEENLLRAQCGPYTGWAGFNFDAALPENVMVEMMVEAARAGIRVGSFSPNILSLYEHVNSLAPIDDQRWIMEHVGMLDADEIARARDLGLILQAYSNKWIWQDGEMLRKQFGEAGGERVLPMRDLIEAGVHISLATDNVPPTLFAAMWHVVARETQDGDTPLGPEQRLTPMEALAAASREGAWLSFEEDLKGTLEPGKLGDLCILSEDLLSVEPARIPHIVSDVTITGGRVVYRRDGTADDAG